jgi:hypothetical protein
MHDCVAAVGNENKGLHWVLRGLYLAWIIKKTAKSFCG